ncbi:MAG: hypothetical protein MJ247_06325 [Alphaproteobacteria bacterium]|nr:hypothetical protein [Alphaproteobacteria bacterium]
MASIIYHSVLKPQKMLFVATYLLYAEALCLTLITVITGSPVMTVVIAVLAHIFCINLTNKEPHINNIIRNRISYFMECLGCKEVGAPHFKTPTIYKDNVRFYYEL